MENFEAEAKIIGFKKVIQMMQENQKKKVENIQRLIRLDLDLVESFVNQLHKLKSSIIQQFDELIQNSAEWIKSLNGIGQLNSQYSFFDELEMIINNKIQNLFNQESIIEQITILNNSLCNKINLKLSALRNQEFYTRCDTALINLNLNHNMKLIDNSIKQKDSCLVISFNQSGSLMISTSNCDLKVWNFEQGRMNEISKISGHTATICCLQFNKNSNSFLSAGHDHSILSWKSINEKEWKSSSSYLGHTGCIDCLILNQSENQLVSGGRENSIKFGKVILLIINQLIFILQINIQEMFLVQALINKKIFWFLLVVINKQQFGRKMINKNDNLDMQLMSMLDLFQNQLIKLQLSYRQFILSQISKLKIEIIIHNQLKDLDADYVLQMINKLFG